MELQISTPILVTGATGYCSSHIIKLLLEQGYKVRGTVRSLKNKEKYEFLLNLVPEKNENLSFVEAELQNANSWSVAVEGCDYIIHVASPIPSLDLKTEDEFVKPAVEGTLNVLNAALEKKCKKVVITSSVTTLVAGNEHKLITEEDWSIMTGISSYTKSKILAEKAVWEFYEKNKDSIDVTVVNPSIVLGPMFALHGSIGEGLLTSILSGELPGIPDPDCNYAIIDVRDVAIGHLNALLSSDANGKRFILSNRGVFIQEMADILREEFENKGYTIPSKKMTKEELIETKSKVAAMIAYSGRMGVDLKISNDRSVKELGMKYHDMKDTIISMAYALIKKGAAENKGIY